MIRRMVPPVSGRSVFVERTLTGAPADVILISARVRSWADDPPTARKFDCLSKEATPKSTAALATSPSGPRRPRPSHKANSPRRERGGGQGPLDGLRGRRPPGETLPQEGRTSEQRLLQQQLRRSWLPTGSF